ncbi:DUF819 family protein, partial [Bacillus subtilis]|uniref:DUF819 family protein n=1 Tax=Bacillus subtilis TaxID=1423 RepID=UPI002078B5F9
MVLMFFVVMGIGGDVGLMVRNGGVIVLLVFMIGIRNLGVWLGGGKLLGVGVEEIVVGVNGSVGGG